jgi:hypothetical protein
MDPRARKPGVSYAHGHTRRALAFVRKWSTVLRNPPGSAAKTLLASGFPAAPPSDDNDTPFGVAALVPDDAGDEYNELKRHL